MATLAGYFARRRDCLSLAAITIFLQLIIKMLVYDRQQRRASSSCAMKRLFSSDRDSLSYKSHHTKSTTTQSKSSREYEWQGYPEVSEVDLVLSNETTLRSASDHSPYHSQRPAFQSPLYVRKSLSFESLGDSGFSSLTNSDHDFGLDYCDQSSDQDNSPYHEDMPTGNTLRERVLFSPPFVSRKESMTRQPGRDDDQSLSPPTTPNLAETDHSSFSHLDTEKKLPALRRELSKENLRELSKIVTKRLSRSFDKELSFRVPSSKAKSKDCRIEIAPGIFRPLRGASRTWEAIHMGNISMTGCMACDTQILSIDAVQYVVCPVCRSVSAANDSGVDDAVGIGFTFENLDDWRREIRQGDAA